MRDTGDPTTSEGGSDRVGYYEEKNPRLPSARHPRKEQARCRPQRDLDMEQIMSRWSARSSLTPILANWLQRAAPFNGCCR
jgi:hypothetical protein